MSKKYINKYKRVVRRQQSRLFQNGVDSILNAINKGGVIDRLVIVFKILRGKRKIKAQGYCE